MHCWITLHSFFPGFIQGGLAPPYKCYFAESVRYIAVCVFCVLLSGCSSDMLEMSLLGTQNKAEDWLTCLQVWRDCLKLERVAESQTKRNSSKCNVQIAQISMCFWQHAPHCTALTLPRNRQSFYFGDLRLREGRYCFLFWFWGTDERTVWEAVSKLFFPGTLEDWLANCGANIILKSHWMGKPNDSLFAEVLVQPCQCSERSKEMHLRPFVQCLFLCLRVTKSLTASACLSWYSALI